MKKSKVLMVAVMLFIAVMTMATTSVSAAPNIQSGLRASSRKISKK